MIQDYFVLSNYGVVNVYQNFDQINYFIVFQKEENGLIFKKMIESENGLKKSCFNIFFNLDLSNI